MLKLRRLVSSIVVECLNEQLTNDTNIWYHGSKFKFDAFKLKNGTLLDANYTSPIFLTNSVEFAKAYAGYQSPHIYKISVLTDNIMDFGKLPTGYELFMYFEKNKIDNSIEVKYYKLGKSLLGYVEKMYPDDGERLYNNLLGGDYSSIEQVWVYNWLKKNKYDGAYVIETAELNLFIFDESKIKILGVQ